MEYFITTVIWTNRQFSTNFLFMRKLSFKVWKRLLSHRITTQVKLSNSNFKANARITTHLVGKILSLIPKGSNKSVLFFRF